MSKIPGFIISTAGQYFAVLILAIIWVTVIALTTTTMPVNWDGFHYMNMALNGVIGNPDLCAPFAYRPGMPLLARYIWKIFSLPLDSAFKLVGYIAAVGTLVASFALTKCFIRDFGKALIPVAIVAFSAHHIKFPIFFFSLVDVAAYPIMVVCILAFVKQKYELCFGLSCIGLFFKEFLIIPLILLILKLAHNFLIARSYRTFFTLSGVIITGSVIILVPRLFLPVKLTDQSIDPFNAPNFWEKLLKIPQDKFRNINIVYSLLSYWLPTLLIITPGRFKRLWQELNGLIFYIIIYLGLILLLTLYGGTNVYYFVSYAIGAQIIIIAMLLNQRIHYGEILLMLLVLFLYNKIPWQIPLPTQNFEAYIDFYGGWDSRLSPVTYTRMYWICIYLFCAIILRLITSAIQKRKKFSSVAIF